MSLDFWKTVNRVHPICAVKAFLMIPQPLVLHSDFSKSDLR